MGGLTTVERQEDERPRRRPLADPLTLVAAGLFAVQLVVLLGFDGFLYHRFTLGIDFAEYSQAFSSIGRGHLNPTCTICGYHYVDSHFELIMWPLSLLFTVFRSAFLLLVVQAASLVAANVVAFTWVRRMLRSRPLPSTVRAAVAALTLLLLLVDPLAYGTAALDFHLEATATAFAIAAAADLWSGRRNRALIWCLLCLLCGDIGGLYLVGVGISALLARRKTWGAGLVLVAAGVVWIGVIGILGANKGSFVQQYAFLADRTTLPAGFGAATAVLGGIIRHPGRPLRLLWDRAHFIGRYLLAGGVIGLVTPWGFGVPALVLLTSSLQQSTLFIGEPFQQFAVAPFVAFGTASLLAAVALKTTDGVPSRRLPVHGRRSQPLRLGTAVAGVLVVLVVVGAAFNVSRLPKSLKGNAVGGYIPAEEAATLRSILRQTPSDAEVIASLPISGRFGARRSIYLFDSPGISLPITRRTVVLVLDDTHTLQLASTAQDQAALGLVQQRFGAVTIGADPYVIAVRFTVPASVRALKLT